MRHPSRNDMDTGVGATTVFPASDLPGATHGDRDAVRTASATARGEGHGPSAGHGPSSPSSGSGSRELRSSVYPQ